jgi:hypothetical protein
MSVAELLQGSPLTDLQKGALIELYTNKMFATSL